MKVTGALILIITLAFTVTAGSLFATERMVLGELFTNTGCGPCRNANLTLDNVVENHIDDLAVIRYHPWWPDANDPFYRANMTENRARTNYYGADYVPHFWIDGIVDGGSSHSSWDYKVTVRSGMDTPLEIHLDGYYDDATREGEICAIFIGTAPITQTNLYTHFVLTESNIYYVAPNGLLWHHQTMRDMIPDAIGAPITINEGDTVEVCTPFTVNANWDEMECQLVVWVQSNNNKEVLQAAKWDIPSVSVLAEPEATVIPRGGKLKYLATVANNSDEAQDFDAWGEVYLRSGMPYPGNPVVGPKAMHLTPGESVSKNVQHPVPGKAPLGTYTYKLIVGVYPDEVIDESVFEFTIVE
jgi:thiol-disulfide isomerase/thioredoxin